MVRQNGMCTQMFVAVHVWHCNVVARLGNVTRTNRTYSLRIFRRDCARTHAAAVHRR